MHCGDQRHARLCLGRRPCTRRRRVQGRSQGTTLSASDLHNARATILNSSWPSATYMRRDFQCLFPQRPRYVALISVLISPVPHTWGVTNGSLLASPPNSRRLPASLISPAPHICGASRTPILTRVVWKILNVVTNILVVLPDYRLP